MTMDHLNIHILFTTSIANPNRDDTGAPKQVTYGGRTRSRISSQAMTRAKRLRFELDSAGEQVTFRAKTDAVVRLTLAYAVDLAERAGQPLTDTEAAAITGQLGPRIDSLFKKEKDKKGGDGDGTAPKKQSRKKPAAAAEPTAAADGDGEESTDDGKKDTLVWLAEPELRTIAVQALAVVRDGAASDFPLIPTDGTAHGRTSSLSIAAFGRMFAARPDLQNEAAIQRSHAFTTHAADIEPDYFTAVNDLPDLQDGRGAGHLAINQFTGGVYYWHASLDRRQLWATLIPDLDAPRLRSRLTDLVWALFLGLPSGKQNTAAYQTLPDAVLTVQATAPVALHQAFEHPVTSTLDRPGFREPSLDALLDTQDRLVRYTPSLFGDRDLATILDITAPDSVRQRPSLDEVVDSTVVWILAGRPAGAHR